MYSRWTPAIIFSCISRMRTGWFPWGELSRHFWTNQIRVIFMMCVNWRIYPWILWRWLWSLFMLIRSKKSTTREKNLSKSKLDVSSVLLNWFSFLCLTFLGSRMCLRGWKNLLSAWISVRQLMMKVQSQQLRSLHRDGHGNSPTPSWSDA